MRHKPAEDFTEAVLEAYRVIVERAAAIHGEPRLSHPPIWMEGDQGMGRRVSTVWFLPKNTGVQVWEYGRGPVGAAPAVARTWRVEAHTHGGPIGHVEVFFRRPPTEEDIATVARYVGLLPGLVEVTKLGDSERRFLPGVDVDTYGNTPHHVRLQCGGWPNGTWHGPDCGNRAEHGPHPM